MIVESDRMDRSAVCRRCLGAAAPPPSPYLLAVAPLLLVGLVFRVPVSPSFSAVFRSLNPTRRIHNFEQSVCVLS